MFDLVAGNQAAAPIVASVCALFPDITPTSLSRADMFANSVAQPLICATTLARWEALRADLPRPVVVLGYSVGELAAYAIADIFSNADCLRLANERAALMDAASPAGAGLLAITGLAYPAVAALCRKCDAAIAIVNGDAHYVVGGTGVALDRVERAACALGGNVVRLKVAVPAHTPLLAAAVPTFRHALVGVAMRPPRLPVLASVNGRAVKDADDAAVMLASQIAGTVQWQRCSEHAIELGATVFLELGPGSALSRMMTEAFPGAVARSLDDFKTLRGGVAWALSALQKH